MKKLLRSLTAVGVLTLVAGFLAVGFASSAYAAGNPPWEPVSNPPEAGGLLFFNSSGQQITGGSTTTAPFAAYVEGTSVIDASDTVASLDAYTPVDGTPVGEWSGEQLSQSTTYPNASAPAPLNASTLPVVTGQAIDTTLATYELAYPNRDTSDDGYAGLYVLRLVTSAPGKSATTSYDSADIEITGDTWSVVYPAPTLTSTTTTLTPSPASPQVSGTTVTLNASVSPSAPGTVQFEVGSTDIGSPVTVSDGAASISTTTLPVGDDDLSAVFTPAQFSAYSGSTGTASFTVSPTPAAGTTTALTVDPSSAPAYTAVDLTASVTDTSTSAALDSGDGTVNFYDDGTDSSGDITSNSQLLGTESLGTGGVASLSYSTFAEGAHNIVAQFTPTDPSVYSTSTSSAVLFTGTAPTYAPAAADTEVTIPPGTLTITTPYTPSSPFDLGTATLNPGSGSFSASAAFGSATNPAEGVTVTDTDVGDYTWTASATVTDFTGPTNPVTGTADSINGQNLTFTGVTPSYITGNAYGSGGGDIPITTQDVTNDGTVYASGASGSDGLKGGPHEFAESTAPGGGSVYIDGLLNLTAPSSVTPGTYTATLTFTIA